MSTSIADFKEDPNINIRLRRMNSATSSTYTTSTLPPYTSTTSLNTTNPFLSPADGDDDASSINSATSTTPNTTSTFTPTHAFKIHSLGKPRISFPLPPKDLSIPIYSLPLSKTETSLNPTYLSLRPERRSGSCSLFRANDESETPLAKTTYVFGPGRPPKIWLSNLLSSSSSSLSHSIDNANANGNTDARGGEEFEMISKSIFHRTVTFTLRNNERFEWRYASSKEKRKFSSPPPNNLLLLEKLGGGKGKGEEKVVLARLVRSDETRTEGSKASDAGNGGVLEMVCEDGGNEGGGRVEMVIVTCLVMLKKEIDRLRAVQIGVMSGAGS